MKLEKIQFNNHEIFNNLQMDFKDENGNILDTIVVIGENGSGKTTLLKSIYDSFDTDEHGYKELENNEVELTPALYTTTVKLEDNEIGMLQPEVVFLGKRCCINEPKVVYMPTLLILKRLIKLIIH